MRYTEEEKREILTYRGDEPCRTCGAGYECLGCPKGDEYKSRFSIARSMGVLDQAERFNRAVALNIEMQKIVREFQEDIAEEVAALNRTGLPKKLILERIQQATKVWLPGR